MRALLGISAYAANTNSQLPDLDSPAVKTARKAQGGQLAPLPVSQTRWFLSDLEAATYAADAGFLDAAARLMRAARQDGIYAGVLSTRTAGLVRLAKKFRGNPEIVKALEAGHDSVRSVFDEMFPPNELALLAADGIELGVGVAEMVPVVGRSYPVMVRQNPEMLVYRWNENRWYFRSIAGLLPITPGDGRWILHTPGGRIAPWQSALWRAIGRAYINKEAAALHKANWEGKLANPARVAVSPQGAGEAQKQRWFQSVMAWGVNTVFGVTPGYDVKLLESNGRGYEAFDATMDRSDREFVIAVAGQVVTTDGGAGFQNSDIHKSIRSDLIQETAESLAYTLNTQGIPAYVVANFGEDALETSPCVSWDVTPPKDRNSEAQSMIAVATAIAQLGAALRPYGLQPDVQSICAKFGVAIDGDLDGDGVPDAPVTPAKLDPTLEAEAVGKPAAPAAAPALKEAA